MSLEETDIQAVLAGGSPAAARFLADLKQLVFRIARRQYRFSPEDSEDVLAQLIEKLWENDGDALRRWRGDSPLPIYLAVVANRFCLMRLRTRKRSIEAHDDDEAERVPAPAAADPVLARERWAACRAALERLAERDRRIIEMRYLADLGYDEIVSGLGGTHGAARKALHTALDRLRADLRRNAPDFFGG